jgi:hypothetical protein
MKRVIAAAGLSVLALTAAACSSSSSSTGDVVLERPAAELRANPELLKESYLGRTA